MSGPRRLLVPGWTAVHCYASHPRDITIMEGAPEDLPIAFYRVERDVLVALPDVLADVFAQDSSSTIPGALRSVARLRARVGDAGLRMLLTAQGATSDALAAVTPEP